MVFRLVEAENATCNLQSLLAINVRLWKSVTNNESERKIGNCSVEKTNWMSLALIT